ncbi:hypothetical protein [Tropicimonas marinistellae]|uniref:hypothetical protein n=1 Tax=Tropicimonas marinistellae TaxID=1739787 RepID=UPI00082A497D|nr:hypothetical protein [Tropicimonas marinistellae]
MKLRSILFATVAIAAAGAQAQTHSQHAAPYAGLQTRAIKSLSDEDIAEIRAGAGWGLALPAELNGQPGPAHLLELQDEIGLSPAQVAEIEAIHQEMQAEAIAAGERLLAAEAALDAAFASGTLEPEALRLLVTEAGEARAALRFVHLSRHLATPSLLSEAQISRYTVLRGYRDDPCASVPDGHDAEMWRKHNHCD